MRRDIYVIQVSVLEGVSVELLISTEAICAHGQHRSVVPLLLSPGKCNLFITKTCPCKVYPPEPHFYIVKLGYVGVYLFFLFLLQNIDCGYSLEPPRLAKIRKT